MKNFNQEDITKSLTTFNDQNQKERIDDMKKPVTEDIEDSSIDKSMVLNLIKASQAMLESKKHIDVTLPKLGEVPNLIEQMQENQSASKRSREHNLTQNHQDCVNLIRPDPK